MALLYDFGVNRKQNAKPSGLPPQRKHCPFPERICFENRTWWCGARIKGIAAKSWKCNLPSGSRCQLMHQFLQVWKASWGRLTVDFATHLVGIYIDAFLCSVCLASPPLWRHHACSADFRAGGFYSTRMLRAFE